MVWMDQLLDPDDDPDGLVESTYLRRRLQEIENDIEPVDPEGQDVAHSSTEFSRNKYIKQIPVLVWLQATTRRKVKTRESQTSTTNTPFWRTLND